jgi:hypothetical protein
MGLCSHRVPPVLDRGELLAEFRVDLGEYVADDGTQDEQNSNHNDSNQNKDQRVLDEALAFFLRGEQHGVFTSFRFAISPKANPEIIVL